MQTAPPGATVRCAACKQAFRVAQADTRDESAVPRDASADPQAAFDVHAHSTASLEPTQEIRPAGGIAASRISRRNSPLRLYLLLGLLLVACLAAVFALQGRRIDLGRLASPKAAPDSAGEMQPTAPGNAVPWTDASRFSQRIRRVRVAIPRVVLGEVRGKDASNKVMISEDQDFLLVYVRITNVGDDSVHYRSWYGNAFDDEGAIRLAQLTDDEGRPFDMMTFADAVSIRGHHPEVTLDPQDSCEDVMVFATSARATSELAEHLDLELPAAACGARGVYRFRIPRQMISGGAAAGASGPATQETAP
jgi:hypothetical protein